MSEINFKRDYVEVIYNEKDRPFTKYPYKLTQYLSLKYNLLKGQKLLDLGCGRGEFLRGFFMCGLDVYGVDQSMIAKSICPEAKIHKADLENQPLPYNDDFFDIVFSKSVLEHFYYPERIVKEIYRIIKPGGLVITMVPDWESIYTTFYEDYTHRTPFTANSLKDIFLIHGFYNVKVEKFIQLPFIWKLPYLKPLCFVIKIIVPKMFRPYSKLIRFSQEVMLLATAFKPK